MNTYFTGFERGIKIWKKPKREKRFNSWTNDQKFQGKSFQLHYDNAFRIHFRLHDFTKAPSWKSGGEGGSCEHLLGGAGPGCRAQFHSFQVVDNRSHSREESDTATASSPLPPPLGELYKDLNNFEWQGRTIPLTDPLTTAMRIQPFSQLLFDTVLETRTFRAPERPHARPIKPLEDDTISLRIVRSNQRGNPYIPRFPLDHFFVVILIISPYQRFLQKIPSLAHVLLKSCEAN